MASKQAKARITAAIASAPRARTNRVWLADVASALAWRGSIDGLIALLDDAGVVMGRCDLVGAYDAATVARSEGTLRGIAGVHFVVVNDK